MPKASAKKDKDITDSVLLLKAILRVSDEEIREAFDSLDEREQKIFRALYVERRTETKIAREDFRVTRSRILQLRNIALNKLRGKLSEKGGFTFSHRRLQ